MYDAAGNVTQQWVKSNIDADNKIAALMEAIESLTDRLPVAEPIKLKSKTCVSDLLCVYPMGDPHIGLYAWAAESGADFDLEIAERTLSAAVDHLVWLAPASTEALLVNVGDFYHADNSHGTTTRGTPVDVDGRFSKVLAVGMRIMFRAVDRALEKHERVTVINAIGNHDAHMAVVLAHAMAAHYHNNPRVTIDTSPTVSHYYLFGKCLFGVTHGDRLKMQKLAMIMANDRPKDWGDTAFRYWLTGHIHHRQVLEGDGVEVESFNTLAARDAWHAGQGYRSARNMKMDVYHREYGFRLRHQIGIAQLEGM